MPRGRCSRRERVVYPETTTDCRRCAIEGRYIYGIIPGSNETSLDISGVDNSTPVYTIADQDLSCVLSDYSGEAFGALSREEVVRALLAHQRVVEQVMQDHTVLPVKFGTLVGNSQEVLDLLSQGHSGFVDTLAAIRNNVEIEVAATWDTSEALQEMSKEEDVVRARETITHKGEPTVEDRVRLGQVVKACMDRRRDSYREGMIRFLKPLSVDVIPNALVSDRMVMNVAFLVNRARQQEFDERVNQLDDLFQNEITFRVIGPLPPYSFSTVEITRLTLEDVQEAQATLQLEHVTSEAGIRKAYRRLAAAKQRKLSPEGELSKGQFVTAKLKQAAELLLRYWRAQKGEGRDTLVNVENCLFAIDIKRSRSNEVEPARFSSSERV